MGLLDALFPANDDGGLLGFLKRNAELQPMTSGLPSDQADYGSPALPAPSPIAAQNFNAPNPLDNAAWPNGPVGAPIDARAQMPTQASVPARPPPVIIAPPITSAPATPVADFFNRGADALASLSRGGSLLGAVRGQYDDPRSIQAQTANLTARTLIAKGLDPQTAIAAVQPGNADLLKQVVTTAFGPPDIMNIGEGHLLDKRSGKVTQAYEPEDKTPQSVLEYQYYLKNLPKGQPPMDYATFSTAKARAGATNINNSVDMNSGQTYDAQLAGGLGKAHAALANGVEEAQGRARDIAAMQGAIDAIQKNNGTTGGMGQQQILNLQKTINEGTAALGLGKPFSEGDISDKEFLTKFNRQMAGNMAKNAMGSRVTNFEMQNYLKSNPGLDMSVTGNQRLLGIQAQIEQRNIAVGNAIRQATAQAISAGKKIDPVTVQGIITDYDNAHHIKDPITGQDLVQSYALPEFQTGGTNPALSAQHNQNVGKIRRYNPATGALE